MPTALRGHVSENLVANHAHAKPWAWHPSTRPHRLVIHHGNRPRRTFSLATFCTPRLRAAGCHAHGFAWACERESRGKPCPRKAVGMAPIYSSSPSSHPSREQAAAHLLLG